MKLREITSSCGRAVRLPVLLLALTAGTAGAWADEIEVTSATDLNMTNGNTYKVTGSVTIDNRITIADNATVTLLLCDGCTLNAPNGIEVGKKQTLIINGGEKNTGKLTAKGASEEAGIGAYEYGDIIINGGTVNAAGGAYGAGIGGSRNNISAGTITINGGKVTATGSSSAGIGGGGDKFMDTGTCKCGDVIINGGQVDAIGYPGIGPGWTYTDVKWGTLTMGWTKPSDYIHIKTTENNKAQYNLFGKRLKSVSITGGDLFFISGTTTFATVDNIMYNGNFTLRPYTYNIEEIGNLYLYHHYNS